MNLRYKQIWKDRLGEIKEQILIHIILYAIIGIGIALSFLFGVLFLIVYISVVPIVLAVWFFFPLFRGMKKSKSRDEQEGAASSEVSDRKY